MFDDPKALLIILLVVVLPIVALGYLFYYIVIRKVGESDSIVTTRKGDSLTHKILYPVEKLSLPITVTAPDRLNVAGILLSIPSWMLSFLNDFVKQIPGNLFQTVDVEITFPDLLFIRSKRTIVDPTFISRRAWILQVHKDEFGEASPFFSRLCKYVEGNFCYQESEVWGNDIFTLLLELLHQDET